MNAVFGIKKVTNMLHYLQVRGGIVAVVGEQSSFHLEMKCIFEDIRKVGNLHGSSITLLVTHRGTHFFFCIQVITLFGPRKQQTADFFVKRWALIIALGHAGIPGEVEGGIRFLIFIFVLNRMRSL